MEDKDLIRLLEEIINKKMLNDNLTVPITGCLDTLKRNDKNNIESARKSALRFLELTGFKIQRDKIKSTLPTEYEQNVTRAKAIVKEIEYYLNTKNLNSDLVNHLETTVKNLTKEGATTQELSNAINLYDHLYKPAITIADEYIHESSNHRK